MSKAQTVALLFAGALAQLAPAQYSLYFLQNGEFGSSLHSWYTLVSNMGPGNGTAEWSSVHGGSAHLAAGAYSTVDLFDCIGTTLYPGDSIIMRVTQTEIPSPGGFGMSLGRAFDWAPFCQIVQVPTGAGDYEVAIVCDRLYLPGTALVLGLAIWGGSGEAWVHYVELRRGGSLAVTEGGRPRVGPDVSAAPVRALPTPARKSVMLSFGLSTSARTKVKVYDATGSLVREMDIDGLRGANSVRWDGTDNSARRLAAGTYYYTVTSEYGDARTGKIVLAD